MKQVEGEAEPAHHQRNSSGNGHKSNHEVASVKNQGSNGHNSPLPIQRDRFRKLVAACKWKELNKIRQLLSNHPELLNYHDKYHRNLLHYSSILVLDDQNRSADPDGCARRREQMLAECLDCFRYLAGKCEPKLWFQVDQDGLTILHLAVISCNNPLVREILFNRTRLYVFERHQQRVELSSLITALDKEHHSPLHWAVITNNLECVRLLIEHSGVQLVHQADLNGATPLHYATQTSDYPKYRQQLKQMLKNATSAGHASPTSFSTTSPESSNSACGAETQPMVRKTRSESMDTGGADKSDGDHRKQSTPGSVKLEPPNSSYNNLDILDFLAHLPGVNLECRDRDSRTPLLWAASSGNRQAILLLLQSGANYLCQDANNLGPLHCAASHGFTDCLESLLLLSASSTSNQINQPDNLNCTPLFYAVLSGNIDCVEMLLDRGAKKDWQDVKGRTAAHFGALRGQLNTLKLLEAHGANLWLANKQGDLPLHYAIKSGRQQVVAWLLERSPYERPVNAINNIGRAPIHLAILKGNTAMVDFLIRRGANLNQLVKVKDKPTEASGAKATNGAPQTKGESSYHYETALDMARRLNQRECLELLQRSSAKSAASVMSSRQTQTGATKTQAGNVRSLFDLQAADVASPIGFETGGSSTEPPNDRATPLAGEVGGERALKMPPRPEPMAEPVPQSSDSANSSALSVSSTTSLRGQKTGQHYGPRQAMRAPRNQEAADRIRQEQHCGESAPRQRPYRGGINYHNERINASIKCKLYENQTSGHHSFPPLNNDEYDQKFGPNQRRCRTTSQAKYHSAGSLPDQLAAAAASTRSHSGGQQEIVTNVNVYTSSPCAQCFHGASLGGERRKCRKCSEFVARRSSARGAAAATRSTQVATGSGQQHIDGMISETSDSTDATSETVYDDSEREELEGATRGECLPTLESGPIDTQQVRYVPPSRSYTQHLPVILSAEEDRSTSGETVAPTIVQAPAHRTGPALVATDDRYAEPSSPQSRACEEPRFDRSQRGRVSTKRRQVDRYRAHARSPVAEYIHAREPYPQRSASEARTNWIQQQQPRQSNVRTNYNQIRAKVDSHRNDSGLSSHFGDELDGSSTAGRRSKSWSSTYSTPGNQQTQDQTGGAPQFRGPYGPDGGKTPVGYRQEEVEEELARQEGSSPRQTIIKTRRLSVDSEELATSVEKSIWRYKQESKLFEELQNLKRSQIRSGRANEALLVKRLAEHFRQEVLQDSLIGLEPYLGPFTYQAYELYLYDQLRRISQANHARLAGARVPHKFTFDQTRPRATPDGAGKITPAPVASDSQEARNFLEEDLKAERELQQVLNGGSAQEDTPLDGYPSALDESIAIEASGALEDIRVRSREDDLRPVAAESRPWEVQPEDGKEVERLDGRSGGEQGAPQMHERQSGDDVEQTTPAEDESQPIDSATQELEESVKARLARQARTSSTCSSRRSSLEVEQEKLDKLPLRVGKAEETQPHEEDSLPDEKERRQIELQAIDLTSAIITDALGNVSRAGSPIGRRYSQEAPQESEPGGAESEEADEMECELKEEPAAESRGRRRSIVNIGDKIEVVYHKVGIEIDTVAEDDDQMDDEETDSKSLQEQSDVGQDQQEVAPEENRDVNPEEDAIDRSEASHHEEGDPSPPAVEAPVGGADERAGRRKSSSTSTKRTSELDSLRRANATILRRASSPPAPRPSPRATGMETESRRLSSPHQPTADALITRKIFNGFDLNSLHEHKRRHQQQQVADDKERHGETRPVKRARRARPPDRPRRPRSRLPEGPYSIYVPVELIRERWNEVKRYERARCKALQRAGARSSTVDQTTSDASHPIGRDGISHAKSQPSLLARASRDGSQPDADATPSEYSNIIIIYELNKPTSSLSAGAGSIRRGSKLEGDRQMDSGRLNWCQKRMTRIVDVRTLKRTLSLPESLIYSNELLKRFNLLKL